LVIILAYVILPIGEYYLNYLLENIPTNTAIPIIKYYETRMLNLAKWRLVNRF